MRIAVIDLGTNTFNLLVAEKHGNSYSIIHKAKGPVKLGEGGISKGIIAADAQERGLAILKEHKLTAEKLEVDRLFAFATSAIRSAENGLAYVERIRKETGLEVEIISGDREAEFIYHGVRQAVELPDENVMIMDIGGGSVEFIICNRHSIQWKMSFQLGIARLLEMFMPSDPVSDDEIECISEYIREIIGPLYQMNEKYHISKLIGSSGSFDTFASMIKYRYRDSGNSENKTCFSMELHEFERLYSELIASTIVERKNMKGLALMRVEMIVMAVIMVKIIIGDFKIKELVHSDYALKEGVISEMLKTL